MALMGAEILFYPTAIGSEPQDATIDSQPHWTRVMQVMPRLDNATLLGPSMVTSHSLATICFNKRRWITTSQKNRSFPSDI